MKFRSEHSGILFKIGAWAPFNLGVWEHGVWQLLFSSYEGSSLEVRTLRWFPHSLCAFRKLAMMGVRASSCVHCVKQKTAVKHECKEDATSSAESLCFWSSCMACVDIQGNQDPLPLKDGRACQTSLISNGSFLCWASTHAHRVCSFLYCGSHKKTVSTCGHRQLYCGRKRGWLRDMHSPYYTNLSSPCAPFRHL